MRVVIGGTFGFLHEGHKALIRKAFEVGDYVYIGLTTDRYVEKIKHGMGIPKYSVRKKKVEQFAKKYKKKFDIVPLNDRFGPSTTGRFDAIVVSKETFRTAQEINKIRNKNDLEPLRIIKVRYVMAKDSVPISSSRILKGEIDEYGNVKNRSS